MTGIKDGWQRWLKAADSAALAGIGAIGATVTVVAFIESYGNLYDYAVLHRVAGWRAAIAPLGVDTLILMGELLLFVATARRWGWGPKLYGWALSGSGLGLSVAGNIGHLHQAGWQTRVTSALWPTLVTAGLAAGLIALKRVSATYQARPPAAVTRTTTINSPQASAPAKTRPPRVPGRGRGRGRPAAQVVLPDGALAAAVAAGISDRRLVPWLVAEYPGVQIPPISRYKAGELLSAARSNGHAG